MDKKHLNLNVNFTIQSIDSSTGKVTKEEKIHNQVVNDGLDRVADLIGGLSSTAFEYVAIGTDNTSENATDTELGTEYTRENVTPTDEGTGILEYDHTFTVGTGVSEEIVEAGLVDNASISSGTLFNRATFSSFTLDSDNPLRVIITLTITTS